LHAADADDDADFDSSKRFGGRQAQHPSRHFLRIFLSKLSPSYLFCYFQSPAILILPQCTVIVTMVAVQRQ
jgi:hypothetical protein